MLQQLDNRSAVLVKCLEQVSLVSPEVLSIQMDNCTRQNKISIYIYIYICPCITGTSGQGGDIQKRQCINRSGIHNMLWKLICRSNYHFYLLVTPTRMWIRFSRAFQGKFNWVLQKKSGHLVSLLQLSGQKWCYNSWRSQYLDHYRQATP